jgi:hypothetical protein
LSISGTLKRELGSLDKVAAWLPNFTILEQLQKIQLVVLIIGSILLTSTSFLRANVFTRTS